MEFGLLYEWQVPADADRATEAKILTDAVEQVRLAEECGFSSMWSVEHHFLEGFSHASAPEVLLSFVAAGRICPDTTLPMAARLCALVRKLHPAVEPARRKTVQRALSG